MKKVKYLFSIIIFAVSLFTITPSQAGNGNGNNGNGNGNGGSGSNGNGSGGGNNGSGGGNGGGASLPINNGLVFLLIAGTIIGVKVVYNNTRKTESLV